MNKLANKPGLYPTTMGWVCTKTGQIVIHRKISQNLIDAWTLDKLSREGEKEEQRNKRRNTRSVRNVEKQSDVIKPHISEEVVTEVVEEVVTEVVEEVVTEVVEEVVAEVVEEVVFDVRWLELLADDVDLKQFTKNDIESIARTQGYELDARLTKANMLLQLKEMIAA